MKHLSSFFCSLLIAQFGWAQEIERPLFYSPEKASRYAQERDWPERQLRGGGSLSLPFFDDFATYSLPTNDPSIPVELQRWEDDNVFINCSFPIMPPTVGVATFDGLDRTGYPYSFVPDSHGPADTLTSLPINLAPYSANDNVYLHFMYQGGGIGNAPEPIDSLMLEFFAPLGGDNPWTKVWSVPGSAMENFEQVFVHVNNPVWLQDGFKFRFRNKSTLTGNLDHWHLDYVWMNNGIVPEEFDIFEVGFVNCPNTLLQDYTAMPWTHFVTNPPQFMRQSIQTTQRNLSNLQADNVTSGFKVDHEGLIENYQNAFSNIFVAPNEPFTTDYAVNSSPNMFSYNPDVNDTCATFDVSFYQDNIGFLADEKIGVPNNDSIVFKQVFENYYAYDDGTAERGYSLNIAGGRVAVKYTVATTDTLLGLFIHFTPFQNDNSLQNFILRVWDDNGGIPGEEIGENFLFHQPNYFQNGYNVFRFYELDNPVEVNGTIYVGFVQDSPAELNIGLDKNNNTNTTRLFFQLGFGSQWTQSTITGSVMIRPVFKSGKSGVWNSVEEQPLPEFNVYPTPFANTLSIESLEWASVGQWCELLLFDRNGRMVHQDRMWGARHELNLNKLADGLYFLHCVSNQGVTLHRRKLIKQSR